MDERACVSKTTQVEQVHFLSWQTVWEKFSRELTSPDSVSEKITQAEHSPVIRWEVVWRNYAEQMTEKQKVLKVAPGP